MRSGPSEGWILAGRLDGVDSAPALREDVAGMPYVLRIACDMAVAGVKRIAVVWTKDGPPDLDDVAGDPRLTSRATLGVCETSPPGDEADAVMIVRADRIYHREMPKHAVAAWRDSTAVVAGIAGAEHDAVFVTDRTIARRIADAARESGGIAEVLAGAKIATVAPPYRAFTTPAPDKRSLRRAEWQLVWSLRKTADGIAAKLINRHVSLPLSWLLARTPVHPNHVTIVAFLCALGGAIVLSRGGYAAGVAGMLLVELGSIVDGIDGELARLKFQFSRLGQWLDTLADDLGNIAYSLGVALNLLDSGVMWAMPLAITTAIAFALTQSTQYYLIARVYKSGDLAAIPWAFQSSDFLSQRPTGAIAWIKATVPKMLKRDFAVTMFLVCAVAGRLDVLLVVYSAGALSFFVVFWVQLVRNRASVRNARRAS